jgi:hypothetical protein
MEQSLNNTEEYILNNSIERMTAIVEEDRLAAMKQAERDITKKRLRAVIELYSNGKTYEEITAIPIDRIEVPNPNTDHIEDNGSFKYPIDGTWRDRIIAVLKHENRVLTIKDMVAIVQTHHSVYNYAQLSNLISNTINTKLVKDNAVRIYKSIPATKGFYYGSPLWWDGDVLRDEHKPKLKTQDIWK